jgi:hypothetical protein
MYDLMQEMHPKTLSCSVIAKGRASAGEKFKSLTETINAAGEKGGPLHIKIKAMHDDVKRGAKSNVFPMDENAHILMPSSGSSSPSILTGSVQSAMSIRRCTSNPQCTMISLSLARMKDCKTLGMHWIYTSPSSGSRTSQHGASILQDVHAVITAQTVCVVMCC